MIVQAHEGYMGDVRWSVLDRTHQRRLYRGLIEHPPEHLYGASFTGLDRASSGRLSRPCGKLVMIEHLTVTIVEGCRSRLDRASSGTSLQSELLQVNGMIQHAREHLYGG